MTERTPQAVSIDTIVPLDMAVRAEQSGVRRASMDHLTVFVLSVTAGAFISFGAVFATTVSAGTAGLPYGVARLLTGAVFSAGLIMVVVAGAELFTGNNLIVMAWAGGKVKTRNLLLNWLVAFTGNCVGALATAGLMFFTTQYTFVVTIVPPIAAFVAAGFEHSIANVYFIPMGLFIKTGADDAFWNSIGKTAADFPALTWANFLGNLIPVTAGNIVGGSVLVGVVYWFVYLRKPQPQ